MGTLLQWRASIGNFCLKTGSTKWKPTSTSRTRIQTREKIQFLRNVNASASINSEGKQMCAAVCLFLIKLVGLRYVQSGIDGLCRYLFIAYNRIANITIFSCHKIGGVFSMLLPCIDQLGVRIFIPTPKQLVVVPVGMLSLISMASLFSKMFQNFLGNTFYLIIEFMIWLLALIFYLPILTGQLFFKLIKVITKRPGKASDKLENKCIAFLCLCLSISLWSKSNHHNEEHEMVMRNPTRGFNCDGIVSVAAKVIQMCLVLSGDVEQNPGPQVGCNYCAKSLGFSTFGSAFSFDARKCLKHSCVRKNLDMKWSSGQETNQPDKALAHLVQEERNEELHGTSKLSLVPDACVISNETPVSNWLELYKRTDQRYTDCRGKEAELMMFKKIVNFFSQRKATIIHPWKDISKINQDSQGVPTIDIKNIENKINDDLVSMFGTIQKTYKLDDIVYVHKHESNKEQRKKLAELMYITKNILLDNKINAGEWLIARELRQTIYSGPKEVDFLIFSSEIKTVFVFKVKSNTKNASEKSLDHIAWNKECFEKVYGYKLSKEWNICVTLVLPNVKKLPTSATCNNCKYFILTNNVDFPKWMDSIISTRKNNDLNSFIPSYANIVGKIAGISSINKMERNTDTTYLRKLTSITSALRVAALQGIGVFRFFIIMTTCFSIVSCQMSHPSDRYVSLTTGFQVSKNNPKNSTITLPSNMKNSCQLGLIIAIKSEQSHAKEEHPNETGNIRFSVGHPNLPESQEEFEISSNEVEFRWRKILHNLCFTNCENIQERTVFLKATTDIAGIKNITVTSVRGGDSCEENDKASSDPWKVLAIISIIITILICLFAIILVIKVPAKKSSFKTLPTDDKQQKVAEIKLLPVS